VPFGTVYTKYYDVFVWTENINLRDKTIICWNKGWWICTCILKIHYYLL